MTETEIWSKWESQLVNGVFPLRRFLGRSNHSVVFLTDCKAQKLSSAAIKIIPADPARAETQLSRWRMGAALSHPHLIRLLESGRCKLGGHPFLFVVTEYAEQNLAQILPHRALTADEVREMLIPALDALAFLHRQNLVHGQIVEALTRIRPALDAQPGAPSLPATLSPGFADAVRRCLSPEPGNRPTVSELRDQIDPAGARAPDVPPRQSPAPQSPAPQAPAPQAPASQAPALKVPAPMVPAPPMSAPPVSAPPVSAPVAPTPPRGPTPAPVPPAAPRRPAAIPTRQAPWLVPAAAVGLVLVALWAGSRVLRSRGAERSIADQTASQQAVSQPAAQSSTGILRGLQPRPRGSGSLRRRTVHLRANGWCSSNFLAAAQPDMRFRGSGTDSRGSVWLVVLETGLLFCLASSEGIDETQIENSAAHRALVFLREGRRGRESLEALAVEDIGERRDGG